MAQASLHGGGDGGGIPTLPPPLPPIMCVPRSVLQQHILPRVGAKDLCALKGTCKELHDETAIESIWSERLQTDYASYSSSHQHQHQHQQWPAQRAYGLLVGP